jgi:hypothetical protein
MQKKKKKKRHCVSGMEQSVSYCYPASSPSSPAAVAVVVVI